MRFRRKIPKWLPQAAGYVLAAAGMIWVLHGYPLSELKATIRVLDWGWISLAVIADLSVYVVHAWRWNTLLAPVIRLRFWRTVQAIYIGLFANEILPLRTGEVIRIYLLAHWNDLRLSLGFASAAVERLIDGLFMLLAFFITATVVKNMPGNLTLLVQFLGALLIAGVIVLVWIVRRKQHAHSFVSESRWAATLRHVIEGLHLMGNRRTIVKTTLISGLYLALQVFSIFALMRSYGMDLSFWVAGGVLAIVRFAIVVPNAPGNLGLYQFAVVLALGLFDVETIDAKTLSFIIFFTLTAPLLVGGFIAVALAGVNLKELRERARRGADALREPAAKPGEP